MKVRANLQSLFWALFLLFFVTRFLLAFRPHGVFWDEAVYFAMGKYLYSLGTVGLWEALRPIFLPFLFGATWKFGFFPFFFSEMIVILFSAGYVILTYIIARYFVGEKIAVLSGLIVLLTPSFFKHSALFLTDIPSTFFVLFALLLIYKQNYFFAGVFSGAAFLTRFPQGLIVLCVTALLLPRWRSHLTYYLNYLAGFAVSITPFLIFNYFMYQNETTLFYSLIRPLIFAAEAQGNIWAAEGSSLFFYFIEMIKDNPLFIFALVGVAVYFAQKKYRSEFNILFFTFFIYLFYFSIIINKQLRFGLAFLPFLAIISAYGIFYLFNLLKQWHLHPILIIVFIGLGVFSVYSERTIVDERANFEPEITEFYRYPFEGVVLTSDPVPAAYSNARFIPYYTGIPSVQQMNDHLSNDEVSAVIYTPRSFPCLEEDLECKRLRSELFTVINSHTLIFNQSYWGEQYLIYSIT